MQNKLAGCHVAIDYLQCICGHRKFRHYQGVSLCDDCDCVGFHTNMTDSLKGDMCVTTEAAPPSHNGGSPAAEQRGVTGKPVIVGSQWHNFQGESELCEGIIGDGKNLICNQERDAPIHSEENKPQWMKESGLKDSGQRLNFESGMVRDVSTDKPRFDLVVPVGIPFKELMLTRWAELLRKGAIKYSERNWEKADSAEELYRAKESAFRHFMQWFSGETDEDHAAAVFFNINEVETISYKQTNKQKEV